MTELLDTVKEMHQIIQNLSSKEDDVSFTNKEISDPAYWKIKKRIKTAKVVADNLLRDVEYEMDGVLEDIDDEADKNCYCDCTYCETCEYK